MIMNRCIHIFWRGDLRVAPVTRTRQRAFLLLLTLACALPLHADTVLLRDPSVQRHTAIQHVGEDGVVMADETVIPWADVRRVVFDRFAVPAKSSGLLLVNGTLLNGYIRKREAAFMEFRSASLGALNIPLEAIAAVYYAGRENLPARLPQPREPIWIDRLGAQHTGKVLWFDAETIGVIGSEGLERIPVQRVNVLVLQRVSVPREARLRLRNGDGFIGPFRFDGEHMVFTLLDREHQVPSGAWAEIIQP
jgi:hypothetical protein